MAALVAVFAVGCSNQTDTSAQDGSSPPAVSQEQQTTLEDGIYSADFETDSSMFRVNETCDGKGKLTVQDGKMTIHISLTSQTVSYTHLDVYKRQLYHRLCPWQSS